MRGALHPGLCPPKFPIRANQIFGGEINTTGHQRADFRLVYGSEIIRELAAGNVVAVACFGVLDNLMFHREVHPGVLLGPGVRIGLKATPRPVFDIGAGYRVADYFMRAFLADFLFQSFNYGDDDSRLNFHGVENFIIGQFSLLSLERRIVEGIARRELPCSSPAQESQIHGEGGASILPECLTAQGIRPIVELS
jgi:hypothetical protein